jgi:hypothetical protein
MTEQQLWSFLLSKLKGGGIFQRHEDRISQGIPDVSFSIRGIGHGWIELKAVGGVPPADVVRLPHFTDLQRAWIHTHGSVGGACFVLVAVGEGLYLFDWTSAYKLGSMTRDEMREQALFYGLKSKFDRSEFLSAVRRSALFWRAEQEAAQRASFLGDGGR